MCGLSRISLGAMRLGCCLRGASMSLGRLSATVELLSWGPFNVGQISYSGPSRLLRHGVYECGFQDYENDAGCAKCLHLIYHGRPPLWPPDGTSSSAELSEPCSRTRFHYLVLFHLLINKESPVLLVQTLRLVSGDEFRRGLGSRRYVLPRCGSEAGRTIFHFSTVRCWNVLPDYIRAEDRPSDFKRMLSAFLVAKEGKCCYFVSSTNILNLCSAQAILSSV